MQIYYEKKGRQIGPKSLSDLHPLEIERDTLIWFEGQTEWIKAEDVSELSNYFKSSPPPLPSKLNNYIKSTYDLTYKRERHAIEIGVILLIFSLLFWVFVTFYFENQSVAVIQRSLLPLISFPIRILVCIYVVNIAKRQNRNSRIWGVFSFFIPSITLIIIGFLKRLKIEGQPTYKELTADYRTYEQKKIDAQRFNRLNNIIRKGFSLLMAIGLIALIILFLLD